MSERFDKLARSMSSALSRRRLLAKLGAGIAGAVLGVTATNGNNNSAQAFFVNRPRLTNRPHIRVTPEEGDDRVKLRPRGTTGFRVNNISFGR